MTNVKRDKRQKSNGAEAVFRSNVLSLVSGTTISQILALCLTPVLTKLFTPAEMGEYNNYISIASIITIVVCFSYDKAVMIPGSDAEANVLKKISYIASAIVTIITAFVCIAFRHQIAGVLNASHLSTWILLMPVSVALAGLFQVRSQGLARQKVFSQIAVANIIISVASVLLQIIIKIEGTLFYGGLILGTVMGHLLGTLYIFVKSAGSNDHASDILAKGETLKMAYRYRKFPLLDMPAEIINNISYTLPSLMLSGFYDPSVTGLYGMGYRIISLPATFIGGSISQVFYTEACDRYRKGSLGSFVMDIWALLFGMGFVPILLIALVGPDLFGLVLGDKWRMSGVYVRYLAAWVVFLFSYSPLTHIFNIVGKQQIRLRLNLVLALMRLAVLYIGGKMLTAEKAIMLYGAVSAVLVCFNLLVTHRVAGNSIRKMIRKLLSTVAHEIAYLVPTVISLILGISPVITIFIAVGSGLLFVFIDGRKIYRKMAAF